MIVDVLRVAVIGLVVLFLWDVWQLVRKQSSALDRDQDILDQITIHEPQPGHDDDDDGPQFAIDMSWDEQTAVLEFIDQFRAIRAHHERRQQ